MAEKCCCCGNAEGEEKKTIRSDEQKKKLINRLKRIEGQVRGLQNMIENDSYCNDILVQSSAVSAAMNSFNREIISSHMHGCIARDIKNGDEEVIDEFLVTLQKLMK